MYGQQNTKFHTLDAIMLFYIFLLCFFLTTALEGGGWSAPRPGRSTPGKDPVPIVQEAGWAPGPVWTFAKNLAPHRDSISGTSSP
jgi:hypothetical protein